MEFQHLKTFVTIARVGSFTKAAEELDYAQSSISAQMKALEEELETKLFERLGGEISLTEDGKRLLINAEQLLRLAEATKESITGTSIPKGALTIGAPESLCVFRLPALLQKYRQRFPKVKLILKLGSCKDIYGWVRKNLIDVAFLLDTPVSDEDLISRSLTKETMVLIAWKGHPLARKNHCEAQDIQEESLILMEENGCCYRVIFEAQLAAAGVKLESILEFGSIEAIKKCVASGLGISILPRIAVEQELTSGLLADLHWNCLHDNIHTQMIYHKDKWISPALAAFMQLAEEIQSAS